MDVLLPYNKIAFDFDDTLVGGKHSPALWQFINDHPEKSFYIVTHRTSAQAQTLPDELARDTTLTFDQFAGLYTLPIRLSVEFEHDSHLRRMSNLPPLESCQEDALMPGEYKFLNWKGYAAMRAGASVLIDDLPKLSELGCKKYHVILINARTIGQTPVDESVATDIRIPYRYWYNPATDDLIEIGEEHGKYVYDHPDLFGLKNTKDMEWTSGFLRQMVEDAKQNGWVRINRLKKRPEYYTMAGNDSKAILKCARKMDRKTHYIGHLMTSFGSVEGDDVRSYLRRGIIPA